MKRRWRTESPNLSVQLSEAERQFPRIRDAYERVAMEAEMHPERGRLVATPNRPRVWLMTIEAQPKLNLPEVTIIYRYTADTIAFMAIRVAMPIPF